MNIKNYVLIAPFVSFAAGYLIMQQFMSSPETIAPALVGKHVHEILGAITNDKLSIRLIDHKEEPDLPEGIILNQTPAAGTTIKQNQPIFIVTTKKPIVARAQNFIGLTTDCINEKLHANGIHARMYYLPHPYPEKTCFAQSPQHNQPLEKNKLLIYISSGNNRPIVWPNFTDLPLDDVVDFLSNYEIEPHIINDAVQPSDNYVVIDQRPFAGTVLTIDEDKPLSVQLRIKPARH